MKNMSVYFILSSYVGSGSTLLLQLNDQIQKTSKANIEDVTTELAEWEAELKRLQALLPVDSARERLKKTEIPALEREKKEQEALVPEAGAAAEKVGLC